MLLFLVNYKLLINNCKNTCIRFSHIQKTKIGHRFYSINKCFLRSCWLIPWFESFILHPRGDLRRNFSQNRFCKWFFAPKWKPIYTILTMNQESIHLHKLNNVSTCKFTSISVQYLERNEIVANYNNQS